MASNADIVGHPRMGRGRESSSRGTAPCGSHPPEAGSRALSPSSMTPATRSFTRRPLFLPERSHDSLLEPHHGPGDRADRGRVRRGGRSKRGRRAGDHASMVAHRTSALRARRRRARDGVRRENPSSCGARRQRFFPRTSWERFAGALSQLRARRERYASSSCLGISVPNASSRSLETAPLLPLEPPASEATAISASLTGRPPGDGRERFTATSRCLNLERGTRAQLTTAKPPATPLVHVEPGRKPHRLSPVSTCRSGCRLTAAVSQGEVKDGISQ